MFFAFSKQTVEGLLFPNEKNAPIQPSSFYPASYTTITKPQPSQGSTPSDHAQSNRKKGERDSPTAEELLLSNVVARDAVSGSSSSSPTEQPTDYTTPANETSNHDRQGSDPPSGVALDALAAQQAHFAALKEREQRRRIDKIISVHTFLKEVEAAEALEDCQEDEERAILELTNTEYLEYVRNRIGLKYSQQESQERKASKKPAKLTQNQSSNLRENRAKRAEAHRREFKRLSLDDALDQLQTGEGDESKMFDGWSAARIKAYKQIKTCPNAYYYRFNAPGEKQQGGPWNEEEKQHFLARLREVGANGQWGLFSMAISGRVGYQCSNFYRVLLETGEVHDPNYQFDGKGKAKWARKRADGTVERRGKRKPKSDDEDDPDYDGRAVKRRKSTRSSCEVIDVSEIKAANVAPLQGDGASSSNAASGSNSEAPEPPPPRKRRKYTRRQPAITLTAEQGRQKGPGSRRAAALLKGGVVSGTPSHARRQVESIETDDELDEYDITEFLAADISSRSRGSGTDKRTRAGKMTRSTESIIPALNTKNPLPGFIDPITMEEVVLPTISPYGHVLGYDTWLRALTSGNVKGVCPLTKQRLHRKDLIVLTPENIDQYREHIVNLSNPF